ncbi:hypothetical protein JVT61DRAFT_5986 [Boletus reticuloceps]|uniref:F-box domain-containing protein n=1 Tax=Boletus reticuloceps TaxID=495285 RepID=A0A8I2YMC0_9AGAM|nr:hypothetical protein JVT61DRAFT_5986 [Boletus reticuloceps]
MLSRPSFWSLNAPSGRRHSTPSTPTYDVLTIAPSLIENQAIGQQLILPNLYTQRSSFFNPTSKLPNETLQDIFIHCARDYYNKESESWHSLVPPEWINVSYVCRRWRDVALSCPTLWTYLSTYATALDKRVFNQVEAGVIEDTDTHHGSKWPMDELYHRESDGPRGTYPGASSCLSGRLRPQDSFQTFLTRSSPAISENLHGRPFSLQSFVLFDGNTPALRTLDLFNCPMGLSYLNLSTLKTLNLSGEGRFQYNMEKVLAVLRCTRSLSHLYLKHIFPSCRGFIYSATFDVFQKVKLPHLSQLSITAPGFRGRCFAVLHKFSIEGRSLPTLLFPRSTLR